MHPFKEMQRCHLQSNLGKVNGLFYTKTKQNQKRLRGTSFKAIKENNL
jgi:hypothetical protein